eukprot:Anaeramoba_ignava/a96144_11.p1 GENE.a96144_11~~a96144_11.p1  ORF type:complete len:128 (+),score=23.73 a96144_11:366-749(+)
MKIVVRSIFFFFKNKKIMILDNRTLRVFIHLIFYQFHDLETRDEFPILRIEDFLKRERPNLISDSIKKVVSSHSCFKFIENEKIFCSICQKELIINSPSKLTRHLNSQKKKKLKKLLIIKMLLKTKI